MVWRIGALLVTLVMSAAEAGASQWVYVDETDPFSDAPTSRAAVQLGSTGIVGIQCRNGKLDGFIDVGEYLGSGFVKVRWRFGDQQPKSASWLPTARGSGVVTNDYEVLRQLVQPGAVFAFEALDFRGQSHRAVTDLPADAAPGRRVFDDCHVAADVATVRFPTVPAAVVEEVDHWGPKGTRLRKEVLAGLGFYDGPADGQKDEALYEAAAAVTADYVTRCADERRYRRYQSCKSLHQFGRVGSAEHIPNVGTIIYELATGSLHRQLGAIRRSE